MTPLPRLRRLAATDLPAFQAYRNDPEVGRLQGWSPMSDAAARDFLDIMAVTPWLAAGQWTQVGIADIATDELLGDIGIHVSADGKEADIGFSLARAAQGRGIATAAVRAAIDLVFAQTTVTRIHVQTDERNAACIRLLQRLEAAPPERIETEFRGEPCVELRYLLAQR